MLWLQTLAAEPLPGGYGVALLQTLLALAFVSVLAWIVLRWFVKRPAGLAGGRMRVLDRMPLDARRSVALVQIGERVFMIGLGEGAPSLLAELAADELPPAPERVGLSEGFAAALARVRGGAAEVRAPAREVADEDAKKAEDPAGE